MKYVTEKAALVLFAMLSLVALAGCSTSPPVADGKEHAECLVCKHNADLGCVDVVVNGETPKCKVDGEDYYFCSDDCCADFKKEPAKYKN